MARTDPHNSARFWLSRSMPGLSLLQADFTAHDYAPHSHEAWVIAVTETGGAEFTSRGRTEEAHEDVLLVFNPDEPHSGRMGRSRRWRYRSLYMDEAAIAAICDAVGMQVTPYFLRNLYGDASLIEAFTCLHTALEREEEALLREELLTESFGLLLRRYSSLRGDVAADPQDRLLFRRLLPLLQERHGDRLVLQDLADPVGLTSFQLIRLFRRVTGLTPHAYLVQLRLQTAMDLLKARKPIAEAALAAGFFDQSALNKHFKRVYGITPRQYMAAQAA